MELARIIRRRQVCSSTWRATYRDGNLGDPRRFARRKWLDTCSHCDSFLKGAHVKRTRHPHQVTPSALSIMLRRAYDAYCLDSSEPLPFDDWCVKQVEGSPQFHYWYMVMHLECLMLVFLRSIREGNFPLYITALRALTPWFFALDHTHYSRWVPVHIRDMTTLHERLPDVAKEFDRGSFVVHKSTRPFSAIAIDHAHEQTNAVVKGDGGAIGLTQNPRALLRWMVAGPEIARTIDGFETACLDNHTGRDNGRHHEHTMAVQVTFASEVQALVEVIEDLGESVHGGEWRSSCFGYQRHRRSSRSDNCAMDREEGA